MKKFKLMEHELVPLNIVLSEEEKREVLERFGVKEHKLPKIKVTDPVVKEIGAKKGDVIKIIRKSPTAGESVTYRYVIE
ncbi:MAG: DNA-directed polymerase subunit [Archaeoglobi archaeon]|nr:DNA-directed polymerase subunit [Archaeoglobi archaeon]